MTQKATDAHAPRQLSSRARLLLATGVILILLPCLGLMGSLAYLRARQAGAFSRWRSLGAAPGHAAEILSGDADVVYVRTTAGNIYRCTHWAKPVAGDCWQDAQGPLYINPDATFDQGLFRGEPNPPPGTVLDSLHVTVWYAENAYETRYVLLEDGTVWTWEYDTGGYWLLFIIMLGPAAGLALAIGLVILWGVAMHLRRVRSARGMDGPSS